MNILLRAVPNVLSARAGRLALVTAKHAPTILFATGVVGVVATAVTASKATLKLEDVLLEAEMDLNKAQQAYALQSSNYSERDHLEDKTKIYVRTTLHTARLYAPTIVIGFVTIACLTKSHRILTNRNAALTAAYVALEKGFNEYRDRVQNELGQTFDDHFRYGSEVHEGEDKDGFKKHAYRVTRENQPSVYARFFDELCKDWVGEPEYNLIFLRCQQNYLNDLLHARGHVFLNEAYDRLGIDRTKEGAVVGWIKNGDGDNYIDFGVFDANNYKARDFVNGREGAILLDFNVDGLIYDKI